MKRVPRSSPDPLIDELLGELEVAGGGGRAVFLQTSDSADSRAIVGEFLRRARRAHWRLRLAAASAADPRTPAWRQIAFRLTGRHRASAALRRSLGEWAGMIPLIGPLISAIVSTIGELTDRAPPAPAALGTGSSVDDVRRILAHGRDEPRLIVLTDCEAADAAELSGAFSLIQEIARTRTLLLIAASGRGFSAGRLRDLMWEAERTGVGRRLGLDLGAADPGQDELLRCAAGLGATFEMAHLLHVLGRSEAEIEADLQKLVRANVVIVRDTIERDGGLIDVYALTEGAGQLPSRAHAPARESPDPTRGL